MLCLLQQRFKVECEKCVVDTDRLNTFFHSVIGLAERPNLKELWELIQLLLTLSHGQAAVERGFSVNSDILAPNLKTQSLVAQRMIFDTVALSGFPVASFESTQGLPQSCNHAYRRNNAYRNAQEEELRNKEKLQKRAAEENELREQRNKLRKLEQTVESLNKEADKQALQAEHKTNFTLLAKSNALRQKAKEMEDDIKKQQVVVNKLSTTMQKL